MAKGTLHTSTAKAPQSTAQAVLTKEADKSHHAVVISPGGSPCAAVMDYQGQRILAKDAPHLPLHRCTHRHECRCIYLHYSDRREEDRRQDFVQSAMVSRDFRSSLDRRRDGTWRQTNKEPTAQDVRNSEKRLQQIVDRLLDQDAEVSLDDFYNSAQQLREDLEFLLLLKS
ncbi:MAG: hypothetical protein ACR2PZ_11740 [Pseudomonadales bacterium]